MVTLNIAGKRPLPELGVSTVSLCAGLVPEPAAAAVAAPWQQPWRTHGEFVGPKVICPAARLPSSGVPASNRTCTFCLTADEQTAIIHDLHNPPKNSRAQPDAEPLRQLDLRLAEPECPRLT